MRAVGVLMVVTGVAIIWSALQGRSPVDEWNAVKDWLTHTHGTGGTTTALPGAPGSG